MALPYLVRSMPPGVNQQDADNDDHFGDEAGTPDTPVTPLRP